MQLQSQSQRMCERDSSQAQETSVTIKGMEMMAEAMNREQLGEVPGTRVHIEKYREQ